MLRALTSRGVCVSKLLGRPGLATSGVVNNAALVIASRPAASAAGEMVPEPHGKHYLYERYMAAGMYALFPAALFIHNPGMDYTLAVVIALHTHWGLHTVMTDYARPFVVGEALAKVASGFIYALSVLTFIGLLHFNYNDVGITRAFEMVFAV